METFIVRVWVPPESAPKDQPLCGVVEHLGSATETTFVDEEELLAALRMRQAGAAGGGSRGGNALGRRGALVLLVVSVALAVPRRR